MLPAEIEPPAPHVNVLRLAEVRDLRTSARANPLLWPGLTRKDLDTPGTGLGQPVEERHPIRGQHALLNADLAAENLVLLTHRRNLLRYGQRVASTTSGPSAMGSRLFVERIAGFAD